MINAINKIKQSERVNGGVNCDYIKCSVHERHFYVGDNWKENGK